MGITFNMKKQGYSSHGNITSLAKIKREEEERGNEWFNDEKLDLERTRAIWVTYDPRIALRYNFSSSLWDFPVRKPEDVRPGEWEEYKYQIKHSHRYVVAVNLLGSNMVLTDEDGGFLHIWPVFRA